MSHSGKSKFLSLWMFLFLLVAATGLQAAETVKGRYVRVELPGKNRVLSLAEVDIFVGKENIAPKGKATQSSGGHANRAIDGNRDENYGSGTITHTAKSTNPWWEVDLGSDMAISKLVVWNRAEGFGNRLDGCRVLVLDAKRVKKAAFSIPKAGRKMEILANGSVTITGGGFEKIEYTSSADDSKQPAWFLKANTKEPVPLLVCLHTWSTNYNSSKGSYRNAIKWCQENNWHLIFPDFRGPNVTPKAMGSEYVVKDIVSAVEYVKSITKVDTSRIYLMGESGGGHCALLMAGRHPEIWAGVSAWVPITDIKKWHLECKNYKYSKHIENSLGGNPNTDKKIELEAQKRSPLTYLKNSKGILAVSINAGIHDGHKGQVVPISHTLRAFNEICLSKDVLSDEEIDYFVKNQAVPKSIKKPEPDDVYDPLFGKKKILFHRKSSKAEVNIFEGGHEHVSAVALTWLSKQVK